MTATLQTGVHIWGGERDEEGHRTWTLQRLVKTSTAADGPAVVMQTTGLSAPGDTWNFGNDIDVWAFCLPYMKVSIHARKDGDPAYWWTVEQKFTTKPMHRCNTTQIEDPLSEPQKVSGSFAKYTKECVLDRHGTPFRSSSHEPFHGQQVEFDHNRPSVKIEQNVAALGLATFAPMIDTVNDSSLWGLSARMIKLSNASWERKLYGVCTYYYTRHFEFDIDYRTWDRYIVDEGNKVLNGSWDPATGDWVLRNIGGSPPDYTNPAHFIRAIDRAGQPIRLPLNGFGEPINVVSGTSTGTGGNLYTLFLEYYQESNFLTLNIPTSF